MARRRRRGSSTYTPPVNRVYRASPRLYTPLRIVGPLPPYTALYTPRRSAPHALVHPATARHSRYLIRTVLTDTRPRAGTRTNLDVSRRAVGRGRFLPDRRSQDPRSLYPMVPAPTLNRAFICARRSIRREVLFAIKATSRGSGSPRRHTKNSTVRC